MNENKCSSCGVLIKRAKERFVMASMVYYEVIKGTQTKHISSCLITQCYECYKNKGNSVVGFPFE